MVKASDCISVSPVVKGSASVHHGSLALLLGHPRYDQRLWVHSRDTQYAWQAGRKWVIPA